MIMLGRTPRRLGAGAAIGAFGFAACLLPLTPSWAQKPVEKEETRSITIEVKSDDAKPADVAKAEIAVSVAADGDVEVVKADSIAKAVVALKQRIEALQKEGAEKSHAQIEALNQAIKGLEKANLNVHTIDNVDGRLHVVVDRKGNKHAEGAKDVVLEGKVLKDRKDVLILRSGPSSPEARAKIEKARARIAHLQQDLARKQKELAEAELDLAKLVLRGIKILVGQPLREIEVVGKPLERKQVRVIEKRLDPKLVEGLELKFDSTPGRKDQDRIEALEQKLSKLLEEVSSLRKHNKSDVAK